MFAEDIKVCSVLHVDSLRYIDLISFIVQNCNGEVYLPRNYTEYTGYFTKMSLCFIKMSLRRTKILFQL